MNLRPPAASLVLASASPRRRALLDSLGVRYQVRPAELDETPRSGEDATRLVRRLAAAKVEVVAAALGGPPPVGGWVVLGADTVVTCDGEILGKPVDTGEAEAMLRRLSGRVHLVTTGVAALVLGAGRVDPSSTTERGGPSGPGSATEAAVRVVETLVHFADIGEEDLAWYLGTGEALDKAGAYGLQGVGAHFVRRVEGSPTNVVGLPLAETVDLLADLGVGLDRLR